MKTKKLFILILAFSLALGLLSACGSAGKNGEQGLESDFVYLPEYKKLEFEEKNLRLGEKSAMAGDKIYVAAAELPESGEDGEEIGARRSISYIYSFGINNPKAEKLAAYEPLVLSELGDEEFAFVSSDIQYISADKNGNIYVLESYYAAGESADTESKNGNVLRKLDSDGKELLRVDCDKIQGSEGNGYVERILLSPEGKLCLVVSGEENKLIFADENLNKTGEKPMNDVGWVVGGAEGADGKTYILYYGKESTMVSEIDFEAQDLKPGVAVDRDVYNMYPGGGGFGFLAADNSNLYGFNAETGKSEFILGFTNSGIDAINLKLLASLESGDVFALTDKSRMVFSGGGGTSDGEENEYEMIYLKKTPKAEAPQVQKLTLAGVYIDGTINQKILEFNKKNSDIKIEVKDYSVFNTKDDYSAGETKLLTEIGAGNVPDILCSYSMGQLFQKGVFIDLLPLIDADEELGGREALVAPVLKASLTDGKLYSLSGSFSHMCCITPSELIPDQIVSLDAARAAKEKLGEKATYFENYMDGSSFLGMAVIVNRDNFVDFKNGKTMFDSQKFIDLLNFAKEMPSSDNSMTDTEYEEPAIRLRDGKQVFMMLHNGSDLSDYRMASTVLNGKINFCSIPGSDKPFSAFMLDNGLSISSSCKNPELAWKFVRTMVSDVETYDENGMYGSFPMNAKSFDNLINKLMEKQMEKDENGNEVEVSKMSMGTSNGETIDIYALTAEQRDALLKVFEDTSVIDNPDGKLLEIISEEVEAFLKGSKTAEETAKIIQNRASIYVSETR